MSSTNPTTTATFDFREPAKPEPRVDKIYDPVEPVSNEQWARNIRWMGIYLICFFAFFAYVAYRVFSA